MNQTRRRSEFRFRIDSFRVPQAARSEFEATMARNLTFIASLPGLVDHTVFERESGTSAFDLVTIATWEDARALEEAGKRVREHYRSIGFDMHAALARWGVTAELGNYVARDAP